MGREEAMNIKEWDPIPHPILRTEDRVWINVNGGNVGRWAPTGPEISEGKTTDDNTHQL